MCLVLAISAVVVVYVAFPHRGEDLPAVPWLGEAMRRGADALPTLDGPGESSARDSRSMRDGSPGHHGGPGHDESSGHDEPADSRSIFQLR
ncbi:hypothetical protein [Nocardioides sp.]|uniref:hypothetical protein n=1 Tax=Nocardioides sp. TaxID=35761 RepID=UPI0027366BE7|nr:hypothetical protein [Nocardioides sp.]MDP3894867.1 hypothetical protein [Nocardioides sp.]